MARLALLFVVAVVGGAAVAGCGSSSSSSSSSASSAASTASAPAAATSGSAGAAASSNPEIAQAVAACKTEVQAAPTLSADIKSKLVTICDKAASGDAAGVKQAASQVCQEIVKSTVPSGSLQTTALAACPKP